MTRPDAEDCLSYLISSMIQDTRIMDFFTVFKRTATHADVLAAIGAADLLRHLAPRIVHFEDRFEIRLRRHLRPSDLDSLEPGFSYLARPGKALPAIPPERIVLSGSPSASRMYSILGRMQAFGGPNKVISLFARANRREFTTDVWEALHGESAFAFSSPLVQLFNPHSGKGSHSRSRMAPIETTGPRTAGRNRSSNGSAIVATSKAAPAGLPTEIFGSIARFPRTFPMIRSPPPPPPSGTFGSAAPR